MARYKCVTKQNKISKKFLRAKKCKINIPPFSGGFTPFFIVLAFGNG
jgi:hypothetical protein